MDNFKNKPEIFKYAPVAEFFSNLMMEKKYISSIEKIKPTISSTELIAIAKQHAKQINKIKELYHFLRAWQYLLGSKSIQIYSQDLKQIILRRISEEIYLTKENPYIILKMINSILNILCIQNELQHERDFLIERIERYAIECICSFCKGTGMHIYEDTLVCPICGFAREF